MKALLHVGLVENIYSGPIFQSLQPEILDYGISLGENISTESSVRRSGLSRFHAEALCQTL
jgi:hypothetical protein